MGDSNLHSVAGTERKVDCSSTLPDEILEKIFWGLPLFDVIKLNLVCKRWYRVSRCNSVWQKCVPKYPGIHLPEADTQYAIFQKLWVNSLQIGTERWFPNLLPDLVDYDTALREEESKENGEMVESKCVLYLRLNPVYPFTTDGLNRDDSIMVETVQAIFDEFGHIDVDDAYVHDAKSAMEYSNFSKKKSCMKRVVNCLESQTFLEFMRNPDRDDPELDEEGYRVKEPLLEDDQNFLGESKDESNQKRNRLGDKLFNQIRTILVGKNNHFVCYNLNQGCHAEGFPYARQLVVSDTAAIYCVQYYGYDEC